MVGCGNKTGKLHGDREKVRFFRVPRVIKHQGERAEDMSSSRRRQWITAISRDDLTEDKLENDRVCSKHFVSGTPAKDWDQFNIDWVPTLNLGHHKQRGDAEKAAERAERTAQRRKRREDELMREVAEKKKKLDEPGKSVQEIFHETTEAETAEEADHLLEEGVQCGETEGCSSSRDAATQTCGTTSAGTAEAETQTTELEYMFTEVKMQPFTEEYFDTNDKVRFYTGLPSLDVLKATLEFVEPYIKRKSKTLSVFQEFVMVLMKLRLNVPQQDLAYRFNVNQATVSRTFLAWMTVLDIRLAPLLRWPEREELCRTMPMCFQYSFGNRVSIIIDCFEIYIDRPSNLLARAQTFSNYKHHNTVKVLIGITPQGSICFVSRAWGGRASDKFVTENSGLLDQLQPDDLVLADRGFTIHESVALHQAQLTVPAFTRGKAQLDPVDVEQTRGIANVRIHVERVIGQLRQKYTILQTTMPIHFLMSTVESPDPVVDKMIRVCSALTNLCPSVVPFD